MKLGFYLGAMSGPGSGSHNRLKALVHAIAPEPIQIYVYGNASQLTGFPTGTNIFLRPHRQRSLAMQKLATFLHARMLVRRDSLDVIHFETLPVVRTRARKTFISIHHLPSTSLVPVDSRTARFWVGVRLAMFRRAAQRATGIVTLTRWSRDEIATQLQVAPERIFVIPFSLQLGKHYSTNLGSSSHKSFVLALGHIEKRKNLETLIRAFAHADWPPEISLVIAGNDHGERRNLEDLSTALGVNVRFAGSISDTEKEFLLSEALCLAMPSALEGFGIPVVEAIGRGTPALVSDRAALPEVVGTATAVIAAHDFRAWATKIRDLANNPHIREELLLEEKRHILKYDPELVRKAYVQCLGN